MASLNTQMTNDLTVFFNTGEFAEAITWGGTSTNAVVEREAEADEADYHSATARMKRATVFLNKSVITAPAIGDIAVFDSLNWEAVRRLRNDDDVASFEVVNVQDQQLTQGGYRVKDL